MLANSQAALETYIPRNVRGNILCAVPLHGAEESLLWLQQEYGMQVRATGNIARGREPRWSLREDFRPMRGLSALLTKEVQTAQREDIMRTHAAAAGTEAGAATEARRRAPSEVQGHAARAACPQQAPGENQICGRQWCP